MKQTIIKGLSIFLFCLLSDQLSKHFALEMKSLRFNHGIIFGIGANSSPFLRILTLSSIFGLLFFFYLFLLYTLPLQLSKLKMGLSFLIGGISGNVIDRAFRGRSIDFIPISAFQYDITFNFADIFQWIGAALIAYNVIVHEKIIWFPQNQRGRYLINPKEQIPYALKLSALCLCLSIIMGLFSVAFMRTALPTLPREINTLYIISFISLSLLFSLIAFISGIFLGHKSAGPLYSFESYVKDLLSGKRDQFNLRESDYHKNLEKAATQLLKHFEEIDKKINE